MKFHWKNKLGKVLPQNIAAKLAHVEQKMGYSIRLGSSLEEFLTSEKSMVELMAKGVRVEASISLISNMKKVLLSLS